MKPNQPGGPLGIPQEVTVFRLDDGSTDHEATSDGSFQHVDQASDGSFQHVEPEAMDTYENMYTAETEAVEIPIPDNLITDEDRELWRTLYSQSTGEKNWRHLTNRVCRMVKSNAMNKGIEYAQLASRMRAQNRCQRAKPLACR